MNDLRQNLLDARAILETGWEGDRGFLAQTADGVPTSQNGHYDAIPNSLKKTVSKHAVFIEEIERKDDNGKITVMSIYHFPAAKWSITGALMYVTGRDSRMPEPDFDVLCKLLVPYVRLWEFSFGVREFHYLSDFDGFSETRYEYVDGKRVKIINRCSRDDVVRLIDIGIYDQAKITKPGRKI